MLVGLFLLPVCHLHSSALVPGPAGFCCSVLRAAAGRPSPAVRSPEVVGGAGASVGLVGPGLVPNFCGFLSCQEVSPPCRQDQDS